MSIIILIVLTVIISPAQEYRISEVLTKYQQVKQNGTLLAVPFTTVSEYMFYLRELSLLLGQIGRRAMIYLAAAVSDFYIHPSNMVIGFPVLICGISYTCMLYLFDFHIRMKTASDAPWFNIVIQACA